MKKIINVPVIIIGAGPAGTAAALELARRNVPVTILNRDRFPGENNICGGALSHSLKEKLEIPSEIIDQEINSVDIHYKQHRQTVGSAHPQFLSVKRNLFDLFLAKKAVAAGANLQNLFDVRRIDPEIGRVYGRNTDTGENFAYQSDLIIFADGPNTLGWSTYGIGFDRSQYYFVAIDYELDSFEHGLNEFKFYLEQEHLPAGYFWVFPKKNIINVGVGSHCKRGDSVYYHRLLKDFIGREPSLKHLTVVKKRGGVIPAVPARKFVARGAMVVGDAAGLVNPLTGGGLIHALKSGEIAGKVAALAHRKKRFSERFLYLYTLRLKCTPHYIWIRFLYVIAKFHLHRSNQRKTGFLEPLLVTYFYLMKFVFRVYKKL